MCPDLSAWEAPVQIVDAEHDWVEPLVPYWEALKTLVEPMLNDALAGRQWKSIDGDLRTPGILDLKPEPTTPETANDRWRGVVGATWGLAEGYWRRQTVAEKARRPRAGAPS